MDLVKTIICLQKFLVGREFPDNRFQSDYQLLKEKELAAVYKVLILSVKCRLSLPTAKPQRMSAVDGVYYCRNVHGTTGSGNQHMSNKIMTLWLRTQVVSTMQIKCCSFGTELLMWGLGSKQVCQSPPLKVLLSHKSIRKGEMGLVLCKYAKHHESHRVTSP